MLYSLFINRPGSGSLADEAQRFSEQELREVVDTFTPQIEAIEASCIRIFTRCELTTIALLIALSRLDKTAILVPEGLEAESTYGQAIIYTHPDFVLEVVGDDQAEPGIEQVQKGIVFFTSGTTGKPKPVSWEWERLTNPDFLPNYQEDTTWLTAYSISSFACLQALIFGLAAAENLYFLKPTVPLQEVLEGCQHFDKVLSTPTFWRRNLSFTQTDFTVKAVTLGGEPIPQSFIDLLVERLAPEKLTHIYASTEFGSVYSVSDQQAGFPVRLLEQDRSNGNTLRVKDNFLWIKPPGSAEFLPTSDHVEIIEGRVFIVGRKEDIINVGGQKIVIGKIEAAIQAIAGVVDVSVYGIPNPITGHLVGADIVKGEGVDQATIQQAIKTHFHQHFTKAAFPRIIKFVAEIPLTRTGKKKRRYG